MLKTHSPIYWIRANCENWLNLRHTLGSIYMTNIIALQWRHNGRDGVSNQQPQGCLLNRLFRRRSKKTSKFRVTGLCAVNSPVTGEFPAQRASNAENASIWWRHHGSSILHHAYRPPWRVLPHRGIACNGLRFCVVPGSSHQDGSVCAENIVFPSTDYPRNYRGNDMLEVHHSDVIMGAMASHITSLTIVYWTVYADADQRKHQSSASLAFVWEIHRGPVNSPHKWPVTRKMFPFDDVIMG